MKSRTRHGLSFDDLDRLRSIAERKGKVRKGYSEPTPAGGTAGLQIYDLREPAIRMSPVVSILRNRIPRRPAPRKSTGLHWKAITAINTGNILPGVSEGNRNAPIAHSTADYSAGYAGLGMENFNTFEAEYGTALVDVRNSARLDTLESLMNGEERVILYGNNSLAFGVAPTPAGTIVPTGGALTAQAWGAFVVALTGEGMLLSSVANGVATSFSRTNADGSVDTIHAGSSNKSLQSPTITSAGANSILWKWNSVPGAAGYAIYLGTFAGGAAGARLAAIVTINEYLQTTNPSASTQLASAVTTDNSQNDLVFDGIITQLAKPGSGAIVVSNDGDPLTVNAAGTIDEFDAVFKQMWDATLSGPTSILVSAHTRVSLAAAVMAAGGGTPNIQVTVNIGAGGIKTGITVESILNPYTGQFVPFETHPFLTKGTAVFMNERLPYALPGVQAPWYMETRQEYYSIDWPLRTRKREYGVYVDEGLIGMVPVTHALIQDIGD